MANGNGTNGNGNGEEEIDNRPGLGTAITTGVAAGVGATAVTYGKAKLDIRDGRIGQQVKDAAGKVTQEAGALAAEGQKLQDAFIKAHEELVPKLSKIEKDLLNKHAQYANFVEGAKSLAAKAEQIKVPAKKKVITDLLEKLKPVEEAQKNMNSVMEKLVPSQMLKEIWHDAGTGWAKRLTASVAHSPKTAIAAASLIAAGAVLGISYFTSADKAQLSGDNGMSKA